jgi:uncharacterized protein (TIGR02284 family)
MSNVTSCLNDLIETSRDGEKGFRAAAEHTKTDELRQIFLKDAGECAKGARQLQALVDRYGDKPEEGGSVAGALHRGWFTLKSSITGHDDVAILEECERGEDVAKAKYRKALEDESLPADARSMVEKQYEGVIRNHDEVKVLRDRYRAMQR